MPRLRHRRWSRTRSSAAEALWPAPLSQWRGSWHVSHRYGVPKIRPICKCYDLARLRGSCRPALGRSFTKR
eukprot:665575-Pyramimonas_sp.AAC.2